DRVQTDLASDTVGVGNRLLGRCVDGLGRPIDSLGPILDLVPRPISPPPVSAMRRRRIREPLHTGVRAIDLMATLGRGQRIGVFSGPGIGKSSLLGQIARTSDADVNVIALIGERGREVGDFIRRDLSEVGMSRCVLVVSTSDQSPVLRVRAAFVATAVAEYFRDLGKNVLLMMDSTTRMAMAQRQIGLSAGEPPTTKGYPPSVFALLPKLLERSGRTERGSITGLYTVLVEGDDITEPVSDAVRGILDGHVWLSRDLANRGHYPAVDVLESISRVMPDIVDDEHLSATATIRRVLAVWNDIEDLVNIGAYAAGTNVEFDVAVAMKPAIDDYLRQAIDERAVFSDVREGLVALAAAIEQRRQTLGPPASAGVDPRRLKPSAQGSVAVTS
ncbi:MAG: FliI/YscN family ATPase, partial [Planctomycetes bacterium]|nr:FliI/YscN family ATPase [Planctomycetota bacterium]